MNFLLNLTRWREWYRSKGSFFLICMFYSALARTAVEPSIMLEIAGLLALLSLLAAFGHIVNSLSDLQIDQAAGKPSALAKLSPPAARVLVAATAVVGLLATVLPYHDRLGVIALVFGAFALATFYSLPPLRFKERGSLGLIIAAVAQRSLPGAIIFQAMHAWDPVAAGLCILGTLIGLRAILWHQLLDHQTDAASNVQTFVVNRGTDLSRWLLGRIILPLELLTLFATTVLMAWNIPLFSIVPMFFLAWTARRLLTGRTSYRQFITQTSAGLSEFHEILWPLLLAALLILHDPLFSILFVGTYLWLRCYSVVRQTRRLSLAVSTPVLRLPTPRPWPNMPVRH